jgi:hypothetical protein
MVHLKRGVFVTGMIQSRHIYDQRTYPPQYKYTKKLVILAVCVPKRLKQNMTDQMSAVQD